MSRILLTSVALIGLTGVLCAQKKPSASFYTTPVSATLRCGIGAACGTNDRVVADSTTVYVGNTASEEGAFINANDGFSLHLLKGGASPDRYVRLDFSEQVVAYGECTAVTPIIDSTDFNMRINVHDSNGGLVGLTTLQVGVVYAGFGNINFTDPAKRKNNAYTVRFADGDVTVVRTAADTWVIEATREQSAVVECAPPTRLEGRYRLPFRIEIHR